MSETNVQLFPGVFRSVQGGANPDFFLHSAGRVGIGNLAPATPPAWDANTTFKLNVTGHTHINGNLDVGGSVYGDGSNLTGTALPWQQSTPNMATDIKYDGGNVGIGGDAGTVPLKVHGTVEADFFQGTALTVNVSNSTENAGRRLTFASADGQGGEILMSSSGLTYNASTDTLTAGSFSGIQASDVPNLSASKITEGTLDTARIPKSDQTFSGTFKVNDGSTTRFRMSHGDDAPHFQMRGAYPTITMRDTNHRTAYLHTNSNLFYILCGANDADDGAWSQVANSRWPFYINLTNNDAVFGGGIDLSGSLYAGGNVTAYSDKRLKKDIVKINDALDKIDTLNGYTYTLKADEKGTRRTGLIAQEVLEVLPEAVELVDVPDEGVGEQYALAYGNMAGIFVEAIKELRAELNKAHARIDELESKIA
jgi:hypothetical protein